MNVTTLKLLKIAGYTGLFVASGGFLMRWMTLQRFRKTDHYKLSVINFMEHKPLVNYMGEPVGFGSIDLSDNYNFATESEAQFDVPLKGSSHKGNMFFQATRDPSNPRNRWYLNSVEVSVDDRPNERVHTPIPGTSPGFVSKIITDLKTLTNTPPIWSEIPSSMAIFGGPKGSTFYEKLKTSRKKCWRS
ncbi:unnamed protein product [Allacma fusca]|uniref:Uncharacterized protein n=1 Tax=Allacma fusca TaxID=39272 RepID=A0A8J2K1X3_9HEXA|nr:unnamed protein product [Allacma fusca]